MLAITLTLAVLLPTAIKLSHVFSHHEHEVCANDYSNSKTHYHTLDLDCDFYKFKLSQNQYFLVFDYDVNLEFSSTLQSLSYYISKNNHQHSTRFLRGPPQLV